MRSIKLEKLGPVMHVTLNRPDVRNAFEPEMIREITEAFASKINNDVSLRAVVLKGAGKSFCAGADLGWMQSMVQYSFEQNLADSAKLFEMFVAIRNCPVPVITRVQGHAMGGAMGLLAVSDIVAAESESQFAFSEARLGLAPAVISPFVSEKMISSAAHRFWLTAEVMTAEETKEAGLVHFVGPMEEVDSFIEKSVKTVCHNGPEAVRATKQLLRLNAKPVAWEQVKAETTRLIAERRVSAEGQEGLKSFFEKRSPSWRANL